MSATTAQQTVPPFIRTADTDITFITEKASGGRPIPRRHGGESVRTGKPVHSGFEMHRSKASNPETYVVVSIPNRRKTV